MSRDQNLKIAYAEHNLEDVMKYFIAGSNCKEGVIADSDYFIDTAKRKVILKLYIDVHSAPKIITSAERN